MNVLYPDAHVATSQAVVAGPVQIVQVSLLTDDTVSKSLQHIPKAVMNVLYPVAHVAVKHTLSSPQVSQLATDELATSGVGQGVVHTCPAWSQLFGTQPAAHVAVVQSAT